MLLHSLSGPSGSEGPRQRRWVRLLVSTRSGSEVACQRGMIGTPPQERLGHCRSPTQPVHKKVR
eukprot:6991237-Alexandrium_andersonii.AAC.1